MVASLDKRLYFGYNLITITMDSTVIHIKTDTKTRDDAKKIAENFGFTLTSLVNAMLKQIARTKRLNLSMEEEPTPYMVDALKQAEDADKAEKMASFSSTEDVANYIRSLRHDKNK
jgi:addiction module RelB/DinJ family antitoxin